MYIQIYIHLCTNVYIKPKRYKIAFKFPQESLIGKKIRQKTAKSRKKIKNNKTRRTATSIKTTK